MSTNLNKLINQPSAIFMLMLDTRTIINEHTSQTYFIGCTYPMSLAVALNLVERGLAIQVPDDTALYTMEHRQLEHMERCDRKAFAIEMERRGDVDYRRVAESRSKKYQAA